MITEIAMVAQETAAVKVVETVDVAPVWAGHPVGFDLKTVQRAGGDLQFVAYYNERREITLASRTVGDKAWRVVKLSPDQVGPWGAKQTKVVTGWDSHNSLVLAIDAEGYLHLSGNMHNNPLLYFRSEKPLDIGTMKRVDRMVGSEEEKVTYPRFFAGPAGELIFTYRLGSSGDGADYYNRWDVATKSWSRVLDKPLTDGRRSDGGPTAYAYPVGPKLGPDGRFHMAWVWRDTPMCETNHDVSYARSKDLVNWEDSAGRPLKLPITPATSEVVDPVPAKGGVINNNTLIGFDAEKRVVISYHKYDAAGNTQMFNARAKGDGSWETVQASNFEFRWAFAGGGSIIFEVRPGAVEVAPDGRLRQSWWTKAAGSGGVYLDPVTLRPVGPYVAPASVPKELARRESADDRLRVKWFSEEKPVSGVKWMMRWETLQQNRDRAPEGEIPPPSMLRVVGVEAK